jgi:hypothetical protein
MLAAMYNSALQAILFYEAMPSIQIVNANNI